MDVRTMQRSQGPSGSSCGRRRGSRGLGGMCFWAVLGGGVVQRQLWPTSGAVVLDTASSDAKRHFYGPETYCFDLYVPRFSLGLLPSVLLPLALGLVCRELCRARAKAASGDVFRPVALRLNARHPPPGREKRPTRRDQ